MPRGRFDRKKVQRGGKYTLEPKLNAKIEKMIEEADEELETRVNFRWGKTQLALVKRVAKLMGVPYQTYLKQVVYRQCLIDLKNATEMQKQ